MACTIVTRVISVVSSRPANENVMIRVVLEAHGLTVLFTAGFDGDDAVGRLAMKLICQVLCRDRDMMRYGLPRSHVFSDCAIRQSDAIKVLIRLRGSKVEAREVSKIDCNITEGPTPLTGISHRPDWNQLPWNADGRPLTLATLNEIMLHDTQRPIHVLDTRPAVPPSRLSEKPLSAAHESRSIAMMPTEDGVEDSITALVDTLHARLRRQLHKGRCERVSWPSDTKERTLECAAGMVPVRENADTHIHDELVYLNQSAKAAFVPRFLLSMPHGDAELCHGNAALVRVCGKWRIRPNPAYFDYVRFASDPGAAARDPRGFRLCCWREHPCLEAARERLGDAGVDHGAHFDFSYALSIQDLEVASGERYLLSWQDLGPEHTQELRQLNADVLVYLEEVFAVRADQIDPDMDLQFHTAHALRNPLVTGERGHYMSLHLQVGVNYFWGVSCLSRFRSLHWAIGATVQLARGETLGGAECFPRKFLDETTAQRGSRHSALVDVGVRRSLGELGLTGLNGAYSPTPNLQRLSPHERRSLVNPILACAGRAVVWVVCGPPGSGKSTWIKQLALSRVDGDDIRAVCGQLSSNQKAAFKEELLRLSIAAKAAVAVPACSPERAVELVQRFRASGFAVNVAVLVVSDNERGRRCTARYEQMGRMSRTRLLGDRCPVREFAAAVDGRSGTLVVVRPVAVAPRATFVVGAQGAGKTSLLGVRGMHTLSQLRHFGMDIAPDAVLVDGERFDSVSAATEKEHIARKPRINAWKERLVAEATESRKDIVLPVTGTSLFADATTVRWLASLGFVVQVVHLVVSFDHSMRTSIARARDTGRPVADRDTYDATKSAAATLAESANGTVVMLGFENFVSDKLL